MGLLVVVANGCATFENEVASKVRFMTLPLACRIHRGDPGSDCCLSLEHDPASELPSLNYFSLVDPTVTSDSSFP